MSQRETIRCRELAPRIIALVAMTLLTAYRRGIGESPTRA